MQISNSPRFIQRGTVFGDLEYTYDSAGHLATTGGSPAYINLPPALASASLQCG